MTLTICAWFILFQWVNGFSCCRADVPFLQHSRAKARDARRVLLRVQRDAGKALEQGHQDRLLRGRVGEGEGGFRGPLLAPLRPVVDAALEGGDNAVRSPLPRHAERPCSRPGRALRPRGRRVNEHENAAQGGGDAEDADLQREPSSGERARPMAPTTRRRGSWSGRRRCSRTRTGTCGRS